MNNLEHIYYINLEQRTDRNKHILTELNSINATNFTRFNAISHECGALGCSKSHLTLLTMAKEQQLPYIVILEDDITFKNPELFNHTLHTILERHPIKESAWDVLMLGGNMPNTNNYEIDDLCIRTTQCLTTTGYIVKSHYYDTLITNIKNGIKYLEKFNGRLNMFAIDTYWQPLQKKDNWYVLYPLHTIIKNNTIDANNKNDGNDERIGLVTQYANYSDVVNKHIDYSALF